MQSGRLRRAACLIAGLMALHHQAGQAFAKTLERDVFALLALYQEVKGRDRFWKGAVEKWPVHTCNVHGECSVDPCGFEWDGNGWDGVSCRYQWSWDKAVPRVVTNVHLPKRELTGPIPKSLLLLRNLTEFDFDTNSLSGTLPKEMGCLNNLIEIDLSDNLLTGTVPQEWGLLRGLVEMELDHNNLWGCLPEGSPQFEVPCGGWFGPRCPSFTTDPMIGSSTRGTSILYGVHCRRTESDAELAAGLYCPTPLDFQASIESFFSEQGSLIRPASPDGSAKHVKVMAQSRSDAPGNPEGPASPVGTAGGTAPAAAASDPPASTPEAIPMPSGTVGVATPPVESKGVVPPSASPPPAPQTPAFPSSLPPPPTQMPAPPVQPLPSVSAAPASTAAAAPSLETLPMQVPKSVAVPVLPTKSSLAAPATAVQTTPATPPSPVAPVAPPLLRAMLPSPSLGH